MQSFQLQVPLMRFFGRIKAAFADALVVEHYLHQPFSLMWANAKKARLIRSGGFSHVLQILGTRHFPKIAKTVVLLIPVFMVYVFDRKTSSHVQPCQSMRKLFFIVDRNRPIASVSWTSCAFAYKIRAAMMDFPNKFASFWTVLKDRADMVSGNHDFKFTIGMAK